MRYLFFLFASLCTSAQMKAVNPYAEIDKVALVWIATNFQHDIYNVFAINSYEGKEEKAIKSLKNRSAYVKLCLIIS